MREKCFVSVRNNRGEWDMRSSKGYCQIIAVKDGTKDGCTLYTIQIANGINKRLKIHTLKQNGTWYNIRECSINNFFLHI